MSKVLLMGLCASLVFCSSCSKKVKFKGPVTSEVTFSTSAKTPSDFDVWTFFWQMPEIEKDAQLAYTVSVGENEYYSYVFSKTIPVGRNIRSDFNDKMLEGQLGNLKDKIITITLKANKGKIKFIEKPNFHFAFGKIIPAI